jgi:hypothetical protein
MTAIGAMRASIPGLAAEIRWAEKAFREAFREVCSKGMAEHDETASLMWLPNFIRYNPPESPNVVKAWVGSLELLPECDLLSRVVSGSVAFAQAMNKGFADALPEAFTKGMPYQEQEQEQKQESISNEIDRASSEKPTRFYAQKWLESRGVDKQVAGDWIKLRKAKRLESTLTAFEGVESEANKAGHPLPVVVALCAKKGWAGFDASWEHGLNGDGAGKKLEWYILTDGVEQKAVELGITKSYDENWPDFRIRVLRTAGVTDDMVRRAKEAMGESP